jgi:hypothetical protein
MNLTREQKAELYEKYLREYDEKARQVSLIESKFDLSKEDQAKIESLKQEMAKLQHQAFSLGDYHG